MHGVARRHGLPQAPQFKGLKFMFTHTPQQQCQLPNLGQAIPHTPQLSASKETSTHRFLQHTRLDGGSSVSHIDGCVAQLGDSWSSLAASTSTLVLVKFLFALSFGIVEIRSPSISIKRTRSNTIGTNCFARVLIMKSFKNAMLFYFCGEKAMIWKPVYIRTKVKWS